MKDPIERQTAIEALIQELYEKPEEYWDNGLNRYDIEATINALPPAQPDTRLEKIADLVDGSIDHFDLEDAMDLLYQIKDVLRGFLQ